MIFLDTHVVIWLAKGELQKLSPRARRLIESEEARLAPIVELELAYLHEIGRLSEPPQAYLPDVFRQTGIRFDDAPYHTVVQASVSLGWTRDPFDRLIVAQALVANARLLIRDERITQKYSKAVW